jgi:hypothetical protein
VLCRTFVGGGGDDDDPDDHDMSEKSKENKNYRINELKVFEHEKRENKDD